MPTTRILTHEKGRVSYSLYDYTVKANESNDGERHPSYIGVLLEYPNIHACAKTIKEVEQLLINNINAVKGVE